MSIFRNLHSIREKYRIAKFSMFIIFTVLGPFSCILGVFRVFAVLCRHCFSPIREKYKRATSLGIVRADTHGPYTYRVALSIGTSADPRRKASSLEEDTCWINLNTMVLDDGEDRNSIGKC